MTPPTALKVRGTCAGCGFTVDTVAERGRVTWKGKCPGEGCNRQLVARRVKASAEEPAPPAKVDDSTTPARRRARKGTYDDGATRGVGTPARRRAPAQQHGDPAGGTGGTGGAGDHDDGTGPPATPPPARADRAERHEPERRSLIGALSIFD